MNLGCQNCADKDGCAISKNFCSECGEFTLEAVGQFNTGDVSRTVVYSCYNDSCVLFGKLVDVNSSLVDMSDMLIEQGAC